MGNNEDRIVKYYFNDDYSLKTGIYEDTKNKM